MGWRPVLAQYANPYEETVHVAIRDVESGAVQVIKSNRIHPFFAVRDAARSSLYTPASATSAPPSSEGHRYAGPIEGGAWIDAQHLQKGDRLLNADESWAEVVSVSVQSQQLTAYNLTVAHAHTYFVSGEAGAEPVWVHNECGGNYKPTHLPGLGYEKDDRLPERTRVGSSKPTHGVVEVDGEDVFYKSGVDGPGARFRDESKYPVIARDPAVHAEGHAVADMIDSGATYRKIRINNEDGPCPNCRRDLPSQLPIGSRLDVEFWNPAKNDWDIVPIVGTKAN